MVKGYTPKFGDLVQLALFANADYYGLVLEAPKDGTVAVRVGNGLEAEFGVEQLDPVPLHFNAKETTNFAESTRRPVRAGDLRLMNVFGEIVAEREQQEDQHTEEEWAELIREYVGALTVRSCRKTFRERMVAVAALAAGAIAQHDEEHPPVEILIPVGI